MPILHLTEDQVRELLPMELAIEAVEAGLRKMALEEAFSPPRSRCQTDQAMLHVLPASAKSLGVIGFKAYVVTKAGAIFHVTIYDAKTGAMTAIIQADHLGQMRTGAASALATKVLARPDAKRLGIFGSGKQARTQAIGICQVRPIEKITVYSPNEANKAKFAADLVSLGLPAVAADKPEDAAREQDIISTATTSRTPILFGEWIAPGTHLNIVGSNFLAKSEIDIEVVRKAKILTIDSKDQGRIEAGDFAEAIDAKIVSWADIHELGRVVAGRSPGRQHESEITLFKSLGIGLEDIAVAQRVYKKAVEKGVGGWLEI